LGFNTQLTGRDNIFVSGALLGLSRKQMRAQFDEIVEFSELQEFIDSPVRTYSSGMRSRLAFAISTSIRPEVLILDEVLSTGDSSFRTKAEKRLAETRDNAKAVVLVSHSEGQIKKLCNRVVWLEKGEVIMQGTPDEIIPEYEAFSSAPNAWLKHYAASL
jgi:ABC-type polysaccharide/polyol phosphate transport system ATPase subunit